MVAHCIGVEVAVVGDALCGCERNESVEPNVAFLGLRPRFAPVPRAGVDVLPLGE